MSSDSPDSSAIRIARYRLMLGGLIVFTPWTIVLASDAAYAGVDPFPPTFESDRQSFLG